MGTSRNPAFLWGVATSSHQVEGGNTNNQWAAWEKNGKVFSGDAVGDACDWWRNAERDFDIAEEIGVNAIRLSVEWSRIEPQPNLWDNGALGRYRAMLLDLRRRGIRPFITLHHFTNPLWFEEQGAFLHEESPALFERFTRRVIGALGEYCSDWCTFNEPNVYIAMGYHSGVFPPGLKSQTMAGANAMANICRSHIRAYRAAHELQPRANVGWAHHYVIFTPEDAQSRLDRIMCEWLEKAFNLAFVEGIEHGRAPFPLNLMGVSMAEMRGLVDYVGLNFYSRMHVGFDALQPSTMFGRLSVPAHVRQGDRGVLHPYGEVFPEGMQHAIKRFEKLRKPIYILEHGVPDREDKIRPWLIRHTADLLHDMRAKGSDIRGYFHWTLTDNFEWNEGWHLRFGLVELDPLTQERKLRPSAYVYRDVIHEERAEFGELTAVSAAD